MAKNKTPSSTSAKPVKASTPTPPVTPRPASSSVSSSAPAPKPQPALSPRSSPQEIAVHVWNKYINETPSRTLLLDVFLAFLVLIGVVQFAYCVVAGNYPFNAFLSGFGAAVGQFVLAASLRMQVSEQAPTSSAAAKKSTSKTIDVVTSDLVEEGNGISSERAFADFLLGSLILHGFCVNFIN